MIHKEHERTFRERYAGTNPHAVKTYQNNVRTVSVDADAGMMVDFFFSLFFHFFFPLFYFKFDSLPVRLLRDQSTCL